MRWTRSTPQHWIPAIVLTLVVLCVFVVAAFWKTMPKTFSCEQGGQSAILADAVLTFSCSEPRFMISCDQRTLAFHSQAFRCSSFDGTKYKFVGTYAQAGAR
ncbi:hypothetical protein HYZ99_02705 [Candidatus Peregrinibacteria bacterium]|nr:hypothetical protein [Candidatus Peregrinibacteria bacterium]